MLLCKHCKNPIAEGTEEWEYVRYTRKFWYHIKSERVFEESVYCPPVFTSAEPE